MNSELTFEAMPFEAYSQRNEALQTANFELSAFESEEEFGRRSPSRPSFRSRSPRFPAIRSRKLPTVGPGSPKKLPSRPMRFPTITPRWPRGVVYEPYGVVPEPDSVEPVSSGSEYIRWVQSTLNEVLGLRLPLHGVADAATRSAIRNFQHREGLPIDGMAGPDTERALIAARVGKRPRGGAPTPAGPDAQEPSEPAAAPPEPGATGPAETGPTSPSAEFNFEWESFNEMESEPKQSRPSSPKWPPPKSTPYSIQCATPALKAIPLLDPKLLACVSVQVPSDRVKWLLKNSQQERGPNWVKQLTVDITKVVPTVNVTIEVFRVIPVRPDDPRVARELRNYMATRGIRYYASGLAELSLRRELETALNVSLEDLYKQAGVLQKMPLGEYRRYVVFVYATFPDSVKQYLRPVGNYILNKFEFDKAALRDFHLPIIQTIARDIVDSWWTNKLATRVHVRGHTDDRGTNEYNYSLGSRRAKTVEQQIKNQINKIAPSAMLAGLTKIKFNVGSLGKDEPVSKIDRALNRRVEIILDYSEKAQLQSLKLDEVTSRCIKLLKSQRTLDKEIAQRLLCMIGKMRNSGVDDRFATAQLITDIDKTNKPVDPVDWPRMRYSLSNPDFYGPKVGDAQVVKHLESLDRQMIDGILRHRQLVTYYSGVPLLGALSTGKVFRALDEWMHKQMRDGKSIYGCYSNV
jgi:hypothetical protein